MKTLYWKMQLGFPYLKVCILGIILSLLGSVCIIISVIGIVKLAWGYYVGTGIWGGVVITLAGLSAIYAARVRSSLSAKLYLLGSLLAALVSFIILVLSAGGLTYKSGFYNFIKFHSATHQMTMLLHGSVLSVGVLSLACNVLSVIVNLKFVRFDKDKTDGLKLRRFRYRLSDPDAVYRTNSLRGGSGTLRSSTSSRTPLHSSDHSNRRSRHASDGEGNDSSRPSRDSTLHRRDSDGSRGSSRSRHSHRNSHHRQSSALHQGSRNIQNAEFSHSDPTLTGTSSDNQCTLLQTSHGHDDGRESFFPLNIVELPNISLGENIEVFPMFHPDEEPLPPYEESRINTRMPADSRGDSDSIVTAIFNDADINCGSINPVRHLPMNIPVNEVHTEQMRERRNVHDSRSEQRRNSRDSHRLKRQKVSPENNGSEEHDNRINTLRIAPYRHNNPYLLPSQMLRADGLHLSHINESSQSVHLPPEYYHITNTSGFQSSNGGSGVEFASESIPQVSVQPSGSSTSLEVCTLTGERPTHNVSSHFGEDSAVEQDSIRASFDSETSSLFHLNRSYGSSDTSLQDRVIAQLNNIESYSRSPTAHAHGTVSVPMNSGGHPISSPSSQSLAGEFSQFVNSSTPAHCALSGGALPIAFGSPNSAFRPVTQKRTPPSHKPISPDTLLPSVSLNRDSDFSLSWKDIPLPPSHNNSNRMASVPTKELGAKNIPLPAPGSGQRVLTQGPESSQIELNGTLLGRMHDRNAEATGVRDKGNHSESAFVTLPQRHLIDNVSNERLSLQQNTSRNSLAQRHVQPESRNARLRPQPSATVLSVSSRLEPSASDSRSLQRDDIQLSISPRPRERLASPSSGAIIADALSARSNNGRLSVSRVQSHPLSQGQCFAVDHIPGQRQHIVQQLQPFHLNQRQEQPQQLQPPGQQPPHPPQNPPNPSHHPDRPLFSVLL